MGRSEFPWHRSGSRVADGTCGETMGCLLGASVTSHLCKCRRVPSRSPTLAVPPRRRPAWFWLQRVRCGATLSKASSGWWEPCIFTVIINKRVAEAVFWKSLIHHFLLLLQVHEPCPVQCKVENLPERISEKDEVICSFQYLKKKKKDRILSWLKLKAVFSL